MFFADRSRRSARPGEVRPAAKSATRAPSGRVRRGVSCAARDRDRDALEQLRSDEPIRETGPVRRPGLQRASGEDEREPAEDPGPPRQPPRASESGQDSQAHLGQPQHRTVVVGDDEEVARERGLEPAAQTGTTDRGHGPAGEIVDAVDERLALAGPCLRLGGRRERCDQGDVRARDEVAGLGRQEHDTVRPLALDPVDRGGHRRQPCLVDEIHARVRPVHHDREDALPALFDADRAARPRRTWPRSRRPLQDQGRALAAAHAERGHAELGAAPRELRRAA